MQWCKRVHTTHPQLTHLISQSLMRSGLWSVSLQLLIGERVSCSPSELPLRTRDNPLMGEFWGDTDIFVRYRDNNNTLCTWNVSSSLQPLVNRNETQQFPIDKRRCNPTTKSVDFLRKYNRLLELDWSPGATAGLYISADDPQRGFSRYNAILYYAYVSKEDDGLSRACVGQTTFCSDSESSDIDRTNWDPGQDKT